MFILLTLKDTLRVKPSDLAALEKNFLETVRACIRAKYSNKVRPTLLSSLPPSFSRLPPRSLARAPSCL